MIIFIKSKFTRYNEYPSKIITNIIKREREKSDSTNQPDTDIPPTIITWSFPYAGNKGEKIIKKMNKYFNKIIPENNNLKAQIIFNTFGFKFTSKDETKETPT